MLLSEEHISNVPLGSVSIEDLKTTLLSCRFSLNVLEPRVFRVEGSSRVEMRWQLKAKSPIDSRPSGSESEERLPFEEVASLGVNARSPITFTPFGITRLCSEKHSKKAMEGISARVEGRLML